MTPIEALIEERLGLSPRAVGPQVIERAIGRRMAARGLSDRFAYAVYAGANPGEWEALLEELVVLETWFFRVPEAFAELVRFAETRRARPDKPLRIVSLPCATGEEAYSIVMALLDAGLPPENFLVDAADVSARALCRAQAGVFGEAAFRGDAGPMRARFFDKVATGYGIRRAVRDRVRFVRGNLLDPGLLADAPPYDVVFCRNLVIYLSERARIRAAAAVDRLLAPHGLLFVGHAEAEVFRRAGFVRTPAPRAFACRRSTAGQSASAPPENPPAPAEIPPGPPLEKGGEPESPLLGKGREPESPHLGKGREPESPHLEKGGEPESPHLEKGGEPESPHLEKGREPESPHLEKGREPESPHLGKGREPESPLLGKGREPESPHLEKGREPESPPFLKGDLGGFLEPPPASANPVPETAPEDHLSEAGRLADGGDLVGALERCRTHLARHPGDPKAHFLAGMIHQSRGEDAAAEAHFERTVYLDPAHHEALRQLALGADRRGERPRADRFRARAKRVRERGDAR